MERTGQFFYFKKHARNIAGAAVLATASLVLVAPSELKAQQPSIEKPAPSPTPSLNFDAPAFINQQKPPPTRPKETLILPKPEVKEIEPTDHDFIIAWTAKEMGISEALARKIINCESSFDPKAINPVTGARGWWQIMPEHASKFQKRKWDYIIDSLNPFRSSFIAVEIKWIEGLGAWQSCL